MPTIHPVVSVCVITYNHALYIEQCLDSILGQQTDFDYEICIGEDDSSDGTREICKKYAAEYPDKIRLFLRDRKDVIYLYGEPTGTFNFFTTLKDCVGEYIAICEGDDFWTDTLKLQKQVVKLQENPDCSICYSNLTVIYDDERPSHPAFASATKKRKLKKSGIGIIEKPHCKLTISDLAKRNCIHTPSVLFKNWLKNNPLPPYVWKSGLGDWALNMGSARFGKLIYIDEEMATYRVHQHGFWSNSQEIKKLQIIMGTTCGMLLSEVFPPDVTNILDQKMLKLFKRAWNRSIHKNNYTVISALLCQLAVETPELIPKVIRHLQRKRWAQKTLLFKGFSTTRPE